MKKIAAVLIAAALMLSAVSCGSGGQNASDSSSQDSSSGGDTAAKDVSVNDVADAVKTAFGEEYLVDTDIDEDILESMYGVKKDWVEEFFGQMPMIGFHSDVLIIVKAAEGKVGDVETALRDYLKDKIENTHAYPVQVPKIKATQIHTVGNYVCYVSLGLVNDDLVDDEAAAEQYYLDKNKLAIDVIDSKLK